jgi:acetolactate synthase-1/3 small subunit
MKHTLSVLVENKPGVLTRVAGLFARRGFNIDSLVVAETENPDVSRMTITVDEQDQPIDQVTKQLHKLINVIKITDLDPSSSVEREMLLLKVLADAQSRSEIMQIVEIFRAKIVDVSSDVLLVEMTGTREKVSAFMELLQPFGVVELMRTGRIAMGRPAGGWLCYPAMWRCGVRDRGQTCAVSGKLRRRDLVESVLGNEEVGGTYAVRQRR